MQTIFTLGSSRSGTTFMAEFFKANIDCFSTHEPYSLPRNPTLFGMPIYYNSVGDDQRLLSILKKKRTTISKYKTKVYFSQTMHFY